MIAPDSAPTLRDDWQQRRAFWAKADRSSEFVDVQIRVLDFLLKQYGDSPEARRPAQYPLPQALYINQRAVLVHHHLGKHVASGVKTPEEAQERMSEILHRMAEPWPRSRRPKESAAEQAEGGVSAPFAGELPDVVEARRLRFLLADPNPSVRMEVIWQIGETGDLDDVGLLMDLLALPKSTDEGRDERRLLASAIEKLSGTRPRGEQWPPNKGVLPQDALDPARQSIPSTDWRGLNALVLSSSLSLGLALVVGWLVIYLTRGLILESLYAVFAILGLYGLGVGIAYYLWERTRRRRGW